MSKDIYFDDRHPHLAKAEPDMQYLPIPSDLYDEVSKDKVEVYINGVQGFVRYSRFGGIKVFVHKQQFFRNV